MNTGSRTVLLSRNLFVSYLIIVFSAGLSISSQKTLFSGAPDSGWHLIDESNDHLTLSFRMPSLYASAEEHEGTRYWRLSMDGAMMGVSPGEPDVPVTRIYIRIPHDGEVAVSSQINRALSINLSDAGMTRIAPRRQRVPKIRDRSPENDWILSESAYETPTFQTGLVKIERAGIFRGANLAVLELQPISYDPISETIELAPEISITVRFERPIEPVEPRLVSPQSYRHLYSNVINGSEFREQVDLPAGYLIIATDALYDAILPLAEWKMVKGYNVTVTKTSEIPGGATANNIKSYIQDAYDTWGIPPQFVLLVGDSNTIPAFTGVGYQSPTTDNNYGCVDGSDHIPDVYVGRFSMRTAEDVASTVEKTIDYEQSLWSQGTAWTGREYFISSDDWNYHGTTEGTHTYCMAKARSHGVVCDSLWGFYGTGTPISEAVNNGRAMVVYSGHGLENQWQGPSFGNWNISQLTNLDRYPIVLSFACLTGDFDYTWDPCFMENWLRQNEKAAVVSYGSSESSFWPDDDYLERRMWDALFDDGFNWFGGFELEGMIRYGLWEGNLWYEKGYFEQYNTFGDPSLLMYTLEPVALSATGTTTIAAGSPQTVDISVLRGGTVCENAMVGLYKDDEIQDAEYTNAAGEVSFSITAQTTGILTVTTTAYNSIYDSYDITVGVGDPDPPTAPGWAHLAPDGTLTWGVSTDNEGVAGYRIYRNTSPYFNTDGMAYIRETTDTSTTFPGSMGNPDISYYFIVRAFDDAQNMSNPSPVAAETDFDIPAMP